VLRPIGGQAVIDQFDGGPEGGNGHSGPSIDPMALMAKEMMISNTEERVKRDPIFQPLEMDDLVQALRQVPAFVNLVGYLVFELPSAWGDLTFLELILT